MPTILLVEDDKLLRELVSAYLRSRECFVCEVGSAEEALAAQRSGRRFNFLVTDIDMPGCLDGWDLAERITATDGGVKVVYTTSGRGNPPRQIPGSVLLRKPYQPQQLMVAVVSMSESL
ncbi:response regulator [Pelagibacterium sp. H642]|uniref:response regulator n=1 Tax=Pelagibacterium sp. H642 TaxID=1881069 RepID=UPI0028163455|nr:response regulator [Pelagibacterium sp. H642]WMT92866.1 response regulator [Pelagibacterium sp. H642]